MSAKAGKELWEEDSENTAISRLKTKSARADQREKSAVKISINRGVKKIKKGDGHRRNNIRGPQVGTILSCDRRSWNSASGNFSQGARGVKRSEDLTSGANTLPP